jgi:hypothetical protein
MCGRAAQQDERQALRIVFIASTSRDARHARGTLHFNLPVVTATRELLPDILEGRIEPGRVLERTVTLDRVPDGHRAVDELAERDWAARTLPLDGVRR